MMIEITEVNISEEKITISGTNLENLLMAEDLYQDIEEETVQFSFDRHAKGGREMKYLYKVVRSNQKCQQAKSMGEKLEKLCGSITTLSDSFRVKE